MTQHIRDLLTVQSAKFEKLLTCENSHLQKVMGSSHLPVISPRSSPSTPPNISLYADQHGLTILLKIFPVVSAYAQTTQEAIWRREPNNGVKSIKRRTSSVCTNYDNLHTEKTYKNTLEETERCKICGAIF